MVKRYFVLFLICLSFFAGYGQQTNKNTAVIIFGNQIYEQNTGNPIVFETLSFTEGDLKAISNLFKKLDVDTVWACHNISDPIYFANELSNFKNYLSSRKIDQIIVYYSGHGAVMQGGISCAIPTSYNKHELAKLYEGDNDEMKKFIGNISLKQTTPAEAYFHQKLLNYNMLKFSMPLSNIAEQLKEYRMLVLFDACRTRIDEEAKSASAPNIFFTDEQLSDWVKANTTGRKQKDRIEKFKSEQRAFFSSVVKELDDFNIKYISQVRNTPHPLTYFYATSILDPAQEDPDKYESKFTNCFVEAIKNSTSPVIVFNDEFSKIQKDCINKTTQLPKIDGNQDFQLFNTFNSEFKITATNVAKTITNKTFKATKIEFIKEGKVESYNLLTSGIIAEKVFKDSLISNSWTTSKMENSDKLSDSSLQDKDISVELMERIPGMRFGFNGNTLSLLYDNEYSSFNSSGYVYDSARLQIRYNDNYDTANNARLFNTFIESNKGQKNVVYDLIGDSIINLTSQIKIDGILTLPFVTVKKVYRSLNEIDIEAKDVYQNKKIRINLIEIKEKSHHFPYDELPYDGEIKGDAKEIAVADIQPGNSQYVPTNIPVGYSWTRGKYRAVLKMKIDLDDSVLNKLKLDGSLPDSLSRNFLNLQVNDVSDCTNPKSPFSDVGLKCFKKLSSQKMGYEIFSNRSFNDITIDFEILNSDPSNVKISFPFFCNNKSIVSHLLIKSIDITNLEEYDQGKVNAIISSNLNSIVSNEYLAEMVKAKRDSIANQKAADMQNDFSKIKPESFYSLNLLTNITFNDKSPDNCCQGDFPKYIATSYRNTNLEQGRDFYHHATYPVTLPYDYQISVKISFDPVSFDKDQFFIWEGSQDNSNNTYEGNYFSLEKNGSNYYLEFGFRNVDATFSVNDHFPIAQPDKDSLIDVTVRRFNGNEYAFYNGNFLGKIKGKNYKRGNMFLVVNLVAKAKTKNKYNYEVPAPDQTAFGNLIKVNYVQVSAFN